MILNMKKLLSFLIIMAVSLAASAQLRVFMTGDSHVSSKYYPRAVEELLRQADPDIVFDWSAKVGASFWSFAKSDFALLHPAIEFDPDILIVHLGTNDSYAAKFNPDTFTTNVNNLYNKVEQELPGCQIVFVTPFVNRRKERGKWVDNLNADLCSEALVKFAEDHPDCHVVDNNYYHGFDFIDEKLIRNDYVHLTVDGYKTLGEQVGLGVLALPGLITPGSRR